MAWYLKLSHSAWLLLPEVAAVVLHYRLDRPILPGDSLEVGFSTEKICSWPTRPELEISKTMVGRAEEAFW